MSYLYNSKISVSDSSLNQIANWRETKIIPSCGCSVGLETFMKKKVYLSKKKAHFHFKEGCQSTKLLYLMYKYIVARIPLACRLFLIRCFVWLASFLQRFVSQSCLSFIKIPACQFKAFWSQSVVNVSVYYGTLL